MSAPPIHRPPRAGVRASATSVEMWVCDEISSSYGVNVNDLLDQLDAAGPLPVSLRINSPGGNATDGLALYDGLLAHPGRVTAYVEGLAASAASVIAMAADELVMSPNSFLMVHEASTWTDGDELDHLASAAVLGKISDKLAAIYSARAGGTAAEWRARMRQETWFTSEEAVAAGLADRIAEPPRLNDRVAALHSSMARTEPRQVRGGGELAALVRGSLRAALRPSQPVHRPVVRRRVMPRATILVAELRGMQR